jgi:hypothetical protein
MTPCSDAIAIQCAAGQNKSHGTNSPASRAISASTYGKAAMINASRLKCTEIPSDRFF